MKQGRKKEGWVVVLRGNKCTLMVYCFSGQELPQSFIQDELAFCGTWNKWNINTKHKEMVGWVTRNAQWRQHNISYTCVVQRELHKQEVLLLTCYHLTYSELSRLYALSTIELFVVSSFYRWLPAKQENRWK